MSRQDQIDEKQLDEIDSFLRDEMTEMEGNAFLLKMKSDPALAESVRLQSLLTEAIQDRASNALRSRMEELRKQRGQRLRFQKFSLAASIVLLLGIGYFFLGPGKAIQTEELFQKYFEKYPDTEIARGSTDSQDLKLAFEAYSKDDWAEAEAHFRLITPADSGAFTYPFYTGICELGLKNSAAAEKSFSIICGTKAALFQEQACWYLALAFLQSEKIEACRKQLKAIAEASGPYFHKRLAGKLLAEIPE